MRNKIKNNYLASMMLGLALVILTATLPARALTPLIPVTTCGQTLSAAGGYVLTVNLDCSGTFTNGINITASNVVFHLAGHTISSTDCDGTKVIEGIMVSGGVSGVRIDGGTVKGFNDGVGLLFSNNARVSGMTVTNACSSGVAISGQNNRVDTSVVTLSFGGIGIGAANGTHIVSNDISGNVEVGVEISNLAHDNFVQNNIINNNGIVDKLGGVVIFSGAGTNNLVANNTLNNNFDGVDILAPGNVARDNSVNGSVGNGIFISFSGSPSTVKLNTVLGSGIADMNDDSPTCAGNTWRKNIFQTDLAGNVSDGGPGVGCIR
jgi:Right handed beta helix region